MARLIDADAIIDFIDMGHTRNPLETCFSERDVVDMLESAPTVDAVEVVRCKDCKYQRKVWIEDKRYKFGGFLCVSCDRNDDIFVSHTVDGDDNDFCSYGEQKDGDGNG